MVINPAFSCLVLKALLASNTVFSSDRVGPDSSYSLLDTTVAFTYKHTVNVLGPSHQCVFSQFTPTFKRLTNVFFTFLWDVWRSGLGSE